MVEGSSFSSLFFSFFLAHARTQARAAVNDFFRDWKERQRRGEKKYFFSERRRLFNGRGERKKSGKSKIADDVSRSKLPTSGFEEIETQHFLDRLFLAPHVNYDMGSDWRERLHLRKSILVAEIFAVFGVAARESLRAARQISSQYGWAPKTKAKQVGSQEATPSSIACDAKDEESRAGNIACCSFFAPLFYKGCKQSCMPSIHAPLPFGISIANQLGQEDCKCRSPSSLPSCCCQGLRRHPRGCRRRWDRPWCWPGSHLPTEESRGTWSPERPS